ncbi:HelD family protein [Amycolatopsis sp. lyj-112]|uniref:HelD family protein n=1 Tax=Amycolatopsis sp. lyj-112 TaxID=2789288 RepID=UPI00397DC90A
MPLVTDSQGSTGLTGSEIDIEQDHLAALYAEVDDLRAQAVASGREEAPFWQAESARLEAAEHGLCFGRLDLLDGRRVYVGRLGLFRDGQDEPLLLDWRAPAARPFYTATPVAPDGVRRRRRITTRGRKVVALDDELLDAALAEDHLVGDAALLAALTEDRTGRMRDIVTTLQAEQDRIVRDEDPGVLVVQGGPGTGKTAVALHRLAYLLYVSPNLRARGVLVVGPSRLFLDYIGQVLPGLGEHTVVTATIADLVPGVVATRPETDALKGAAEMADRVADAVRARVSTPEEAVEFEFERQTLRLDPQIWRAAVRTARKAGLPHNQARLVFQREIVTTLVRRQIESMEAVVLSEDGEALDGGSVDGRLGEADLRALAAAGVVVGPGDQDGPRTLLDDADTALLRDTLSADDRVQAALDAVWPSLSSEDVVADLVGTREWSVADVPLLDEAAALIDGGQATATFGHVVVDEAQELSAMAWRMLMRRCPAKSMTVVGDLAQTGDLAGASSWDGVLRPHLGERWRRTELTVNYRTPAEIMTATADLLAAHHPGLRPPRSVRRTGEPPWRLRADLAELPRIIAHLAGTWADGQMAVIAPPSLVGKPPEMTDPVVTLTARQAKGLEFDSVLIVDPAAILAGPLGHNDLYVAMTRATRRLGVVHPGLPPAELDGIKEAQDIP